MQQSTGGGSSQQSTGGGSSRRDADGYRGGNANACIPVDVNIEDIVRGSNGEIWTVKCNNCQKWGHTNAHCPVSIKSSLFKVILSQHF